jgi:uncharacterized protein YecT (DUF1311 family)
MRLLRIGAIFTVVSAFAAALQIYKDRQEVPHFVCSVFTLVGNSRYCSQLETVVSEPEEKQATDDARHQQAVKDGERRRIEVQAEAESAERHKREAQMEAEAAEVRRREAEQKAEAARQQIRQYLSPGPNCEALLVKRTYQKPSIDCNKANEPIEDLICADAELAASDSAMTEAYNQLIQRSLEAKRVRNAQREFLNRRLAECRIPRTGRWPICDLAAAKSCVLRLTQERTIQLQNN